MEAPSILAPMRDLDKLETSMNLAFTAPPSPASQRLARAVAIIRTEMGHRGTRHDHLAAVGDALRSRRAADRLRATHQPASVQGGC